MPISEYDKSRLLGERLALVAQVRGSLIDPVPGLNNGSTESLTTCQAGCRLTVGSVESATARQIHG
jgi:hypothetical protein